MQNTADVLITASQLPISLMGATPVLKIRPDGGHNELQRFIVTYTVGEELVKTFVEIPRLLSPEDEESIRWYLEEYRKFPFEPASTIARNTAARLTEVGEKLFEHVFASTEAGRELWTLAEQQIENTRVEIANDASRSPAHWELLRNPLDVMPLACRAASFVRTSAIPASSEIPLPDGVIRILLVISRPSGVFDAPFRSVSARLLERVGHDARFRFEVLRPPTFDALQKKLRRASDQGRPYTVVHFDGHGVHEDRMAAIEQRPAKRRRGYLLFENQSSPEKPDYKDATKIREGLLDGRVPILLLNACRSARAEIWDQQMGDRQPLGSLADELLLSGQPAVLAMQYNVEVETASRFVADLYESLAEDRTLAEAVQAGRRNLFTASSHTRANDPLSVQDWVVPVLFETAALPILRLQSPQLQKVLSTDKSGGRSKTVGGDDTLMALERAFQIAPLVVLTGPVGSGKSKLAMEFAAWDTRTRDEAVQATVVSIGGDASVFYSSLSEHQRLYVVDDAENRSADETVAFENALAELVGAGSRALIVTRATTISLAMRHTVVQMTPLDLPERIALTRQVLPESVEFDPEVWQPIFTFTQGNPGVLLDIAARFTSAPVTNPVVMLEIARSEPVGLDPKTLTLLMPHLNQDDLDCVALGALFEGAVSSKMLRFLASAGSEATLLREDADSAFDRLAEIGLTRPLGSSYYQLHPGLPGLLLPEFKRRYPGARGEKIRWATVTLFAAISGVFYRHGNSGERDAYEIAQQTLAIIEPTIWRALEQATADERWPEVRNLSGALRRLLCQEGRHREWRELAGRLRSLVTGATNDEPRPGRESVWHLLREDRIEWLIKVHSLAEADWLQEQYLKQVRRELAQMEGVEADEFAKDVLIHELARMGDIRKEQSNPSGAQNYLEALQIAQRLRSSQDEQRLASHLAAFYLAQEAIDWNEVSYWLTYATELCPSYDRICQAQLKIIRGRMALRKSQIEGQDPERRAQLAEAADSFRIALTGLLPAEPSDERADCERQLGEVLFDLWRSLPESMRHIQSAIAWYDKNQNAYKASCARLAAGRMLSSAEENTRARAFAVAAARGFAGLAPHAEKEVLEASRFAGTLQTGDPTGRERHE